MSAYGVTFSSISILISPENSPKPSNTVLNLFKKKKKWAGVVHYFV